MLSLAKAARNRFALRATVIVAFVIVVPQAESASPTPAQDEAQKACATAAFKDYNEANLALMLQSGTLMSVEALIAQRRLEEQYCSQYARCVIGDQNTASQSIPYAATFSSCLQDEALEKYDAKSRDGD